jgi:uncharacterized delta-60 repeat protein
LQPDGKLVAAGNGGRLVSGSKKEDFALVRYKADGSLDEGFGRGGKVLTDFGGEEGASALVLQPNGKLVAAGTLFGDVPGGYDFALARYGPSGALDGSFGEGGKTTTGFSRSGADFASALVRQRDGRLVVAGGGFIGTFGHGGSTFALARYQPS